MSAIWFLFIFDIISILTLLVLIFINFRKSLYFGVAITVFINSRYYIFGFSNSIALFIGLYDPLNNLFASDPSKIPNLSKCNLNNTCSVWDVYEYHPAWGAAFFSRFADSAILTSRQLYLYCHIFFNTTAFVTMMLQFWNPGSKAGGKYPFLHKVLGFITALSVMSGVFSAYLLFRDHYNEPKYGGYWSVFGFAFMGLCVLTCLFIGIIKVKQKDYLGHQIWMTRFAGSMWGSYWLFRAMELITGP